MTEQVQLIADLGILVVASGLLLYMVYQSFTHVKPALDNVQSDKALMGKLVEAYEKQAEISNQALRSVAEAHNSVSIAVAKLEDTVRYQGNLTQLQYDTVTELKEKIDHLNSSIEKLDENLKETRKED